MPAEPLACDSKKLGGHTLTAAPAPLEADAHPAAVDASSLPSAHTTRALEPVDAGAMDSGTWVLGSSFEMGRETSDQHAITRVGVLPTLSFVFIVEGGMTHELACHLILAKPSSYHIIVAFFVLRINRILNFVCTKP